MIRALTIWYVYELIDPRSGEVFYVGKGKGNRIDEHEKEAQSGYPSYKCNKIRSIWEDGHEIIKQKVAEFWDEDAAYEHEEERIVSIGLDNLTNITGGGKRKAIDYQISKIFKQKRERTEPTRQEIRMDIAWKMLDQYLGWFALWLRRPNPKSRLIVESAPTGVSRVVIESLVNVMIPLLWERLINDPANHPRLKELFQTCNINLEFDPKTV
jgi:hypothetical protein